MNVNVNSGDGNSIFEIAAKYQKMQLREMEKNIETVKQRLRSGLDTGSIKFMDDMNKLNGLILQLKVKTDFTISESIDDKILKYMKDTIAENSEKMNEIAGELGLEDEQGLPLYNDRVKAFKTIEDTDERLISFTALQAYATENFKITPPKKDLTDYDFGRKIEEEINIIVKEYKAQITNTMSKDAFDKLNKVSDTIPNILSQIFGLVQILSRILKAKFQDWSTEIIGSDISNLMDTSEENLSNFSSMSNNDGIQPYKSIYDKSLKPLKEINSLVLSMGELAGVKSHDSKIKNQFRYVNLIDYVNRGNVSNVDLPKFNDEENSYPEFLDTEDEEPASSGAEETKGETTGAGKYYYPKRFL